jgi:hypothetical protein
VLRRQQVDIALPGYVKNMPVAAHKLFFMILKPRSVNRAGKIMCLYDFHFSIHVLAAW